METSAQRKWREHRDACRVCGNDFRKCPTGQVLREAAMASPKSPTEERKEAAEAFAKAVATVDRELSKAERLINDGRLALDRALEACQVAKLQTETIEAAIVAASAAAAAVGKA